MQDRSNAKRDSRPSQAPKTPAPAGLQVILRTEMTGVSEVGITSDRNVSVTFARDQHATSVNGAVLAAVRKHLDVSEEDLEIRLAVVGGELFLTFSRRKSRTPPGNP